MLEYWILQLITLIELNCFEGKFKILKFQGMTFSLFVQCRCKNFSKKKILFIHFAWNKYICKKGIKCKYYASYIICNTVFRTLLRSLQYSISPNILTFLYLLQQKKKYHKHFFLFEEMCLFLSCCFFGHYSGRKIISLNKWIVF